MVKTARMLLPRRVSVSISSVFSCSSQSNLLLQETLLQKIGFAKRTSLPGPGVKLVKNISGQARRLALIQSEVTFYG